MISNHEIVSITGGSLVQQGPEQMLRRLLIDSRRISQAAGSLFIAIKGERHDGHRYLEEIYSAGVRNFIVERDIDTASFKDATIIRVASSIQALQLIAAYHRKKFSIPIIGITGSNGKTIVKEWLNLLLSDDHTIVRSPRSYNSQVGVPLSVWNIGPGHTLGIFEAGISQVNEMETLANIIQPTIGILTNIGEAHLENFSSKMELAEEKIKLFRHCEMVVYPAQQPESIMTVQSSIPDSTRKVSWQYKLSAETQEETLPSLHDQFVITSKNSAVQNTEISALWKNEKLNFFFAFSDEASIENCITCIVTMLAMGYDAQVIQSRLDRLVPLSMRMELLEGINQSVLINDVYSSDLHSLEIALDFMNSNSQNRKRAVILSDMLQSGLNNEALYERVDELLVEKNVDYLIGIGKAISESKTLFRIPAEFYDDTSAFFRNKAPGDFGQQAILIKGARSFRFEQITKWLQENTHDTVLEIDLASIAHNLNYFRSKLLPSTRLMVMVKAFGYGSGSHEVASLLEFNKVDYLAVAYTDEGVALRRSGVSLPVMVMNPENSSLSSVIKYKLEPEIYSLHTLTRFLKVLKFNNISSSYPIHIKVDTGMHRLGFEMKDMSTLIAQLTENPLVKIASVFTHLVATEDPKHDEFTRDQLQLFDQMATLIESGIGYSFLKHALNTGGIQRFPHAQYDMVRLGIGLYGVAAHDADQPHLRTVSTLKTLISQIKNIDNGESVGYGRRFVATKPTTIATIPVGYADGLRRSLGNGVGHVIIHGKKAPILGTVCMDMTMVDITDIPCTEGDHVEVIGPSITLPEIARLAGTISYDILTSISQRVKRIYLQE